ncbi:hypothetical protein PM082_004925 [Marasmius tenuissimus]|nr:hypothetical protein PM082_004925 [Marasmius tenuissimus]
MQSVQTAALIRDEEDLATRYSAEIRRLRIILSNLEREKESLATIIGRRRSWTSAPRQFPVEILDMLFMEVALDAYGYYSSNISSEKIHVPTLSLSQVCSRWRRITQGLPHIWSTLRVNIYDLQKDIKPLIQLYFRHAQDTALVISFCDSEKNCGFEPEDDPVEYLGEIGCAVYRTIMKELHRCGKLRIDLQPSILSIAVHPWFQFNLSFPRLRKFYNSLCDEIDWTDQRVEEPRWLREALQRRAPMLVHAETMYLTPLTQTMFRCSELN